MSVCYYVEKKEPGSTWVRVAEFGEPDVDAAIETFLFVMADVSAATSVRLVAPAEGKDE